MKRTMPETPEIIAVRIHQSTTGLYTATSDALEGVYVAHRDLQRIVQDLPNVIRQWFKSRRGEDVTVFAGPVERLDGSLAMPAILFG